MRQIGMLSLIQYALFSIIHIGLFHITYIQGLFILDPSLGQRGSNDYGYFLFGVRILKPF